ncbi:hypothetical protein [Amycolatopsis sp. NPDC059657]|uniref:hypothetical protein n=1 Tax=Amycolatopsis sp. NPDC059657 TaxID=3346899 RepID=UPI00366B2DDF
MTSADEQTSTEDRPEPGGGHQIRHSAALELPKGGRIIASVVSLASMAAGGVAVFVTENQVGTAVLFAGGLFGAIIALGGHIPASIKIGDNEMKMAQAGLIKEAAKKVAGASPEEASDIIASVAGSAASLLTPEPDSVRQRAMSRHIGKLQALNENYERLVYTTVSSWAWAKGLRVNVEDYGFGLSVSGNKKIAIDTTSKFIGNALISQDIARFTDKVHAAQGQFDYFILVSNVPLYQQPSIIGGQDLATEIQGSNIRFIVAEDHAAMVKELIPTLAEIEAG